jgi:hypothetical protein
MKIALIFWGLTRSLSKTINNIEEKILNHLKNNKIEYKIFLHTYYFEGNLDDRRTGERNIKLDFEEYKLLKPDYFQIDNQDEIKKQINISKFLRFRYSYVQQTSENLICALYSQMKATEMMEQSQEKFDYVWFLRPDVIFRNAMPLHWLKWVNDNRFLVPNFAHCGGINDRMAILTPKLASIYGKRFLKLEEYGILLRGQKISSERFLKWVMKNYKEKNINYLFKRLRANGNFHDLDIKLF